MTRTIAGRTPLLRFSKVMGALLLAEVVLIAVGWYLRVPALVQGNARYAPTQPNTALCLLLSAVSLILLARARPRAARWFGGAAGLIGLLTLTQSVSGISLGIDQILLPDPAITTNTSDPGRMAPNTALAFVAFALATLLDARRGLLAVACGTVVWVLGAVALFGYASGVEPAFGWGRMTDMALLTAGGIVLLGLGIVTAVVARIPSDRILRTASLTAAITIVLATTLFWDAMHRQQRSGLDRSLGTVSAQVQALVHQGLMSELTRLGLALGPSPVPGAAMEEAVARLLEQDPSVYAVTWLDPRLPGERVFPAGRAVPVVDPERMVPVPGLGIGLSPVLTLEDRRFLAARLSRPEAGEGQVLVFVEPATLFRPVIAGVAGYDVGIRQLDGVPVLDAETEPAGQRTWSRVGTVRLADGYEWEYTVRPGPEALASSLPPLPWILLGGGVLLAVALSFVCVLLVQASHRAREMERLNAELAASQETSQNVARDLEEMVRRRTAALAQTNKELREFARFLSHELRQPLGSLALWTDLLSSTHRERLDDDGRRSIDEITRSIKAIDQLIRSHLVMSSVIDQSVPDEPVDLNHTLRTVLTSLRDLEESGGSVDVGELPTTRGDFLQLEQAFRNVLENAVKYRDPTRPLRIRVCTGTTDGDLASVEISDNGRGFDPEHNQNVFLPHYRVHDDGEGTGLGLAITRKILERHGGTITAEGRPGAGTTVRIQLPLAGEGLRPGIGDPPREVRP